MTKIETPNDDSVVEKPLNSQQVADRVDINVLMSKIRDVENKKLKRNLFLIMTLILVLAIFGIYASS
jgi:uncharacterized membrane protein|tara:strand:- start:441 stop:641 length:201 start_codon:yes stop_codon:yes gene_type:complete